MWPLKSLAMLKCESYCYLFIGSLFQVDKKKKKNTNVNQLTYKL